jgi:glycosyltransferase involved in cell wall biosynthesis
MKLAILNLTNGGICGGYKKYLKEILPRLDAHPSIEHILCASPFDLSLFADIDSFRKTEVIGCRPFYMQRLFPGALHVRVKDFSPDVIFVPVARYFRSGDVPVVTMLQNAFPLVSSWQDKIPFPIRARHFMMRIAAREALVSSTRVVAVSEFVRARMVERMGLNNDNIVVIPFGSSATTSKRSVRPLKLPPGYEDEFIFAAGGFEPYRGYDDLIEACCGFLRDRPGCRGVAIAGGCRPQMVWYKKKITKMIVDYGLSGRVVLLGELAPEEMAWCYDKCRVFAMTSKVEIFSMIAAESLAHGCVTVASSAACLPEVYGDTAIYYLPGNTSLLCDGLKKAFCLDASERRSLGERARQRAHNFTWDSCASRTYDLLEETKRARGL